MSKDGSNSPSSPNKTREEIVSFNVGGFSFETKKSTLCKRHPNGKPNYFELIIEGKENVDKDQDGFYFIDRDGDCMRVLLGYMRTNELHIPKFLSPSAVKREARFYNIETPKLETPRDSPRKSVISKAVRLRKHGIYTSDITKLYLKVIASGSLLRGEDYVGKPSLSKKISYEIRGDQLILPDYPDATRFIASGGNMILSSSEDPHGIPTMYFAPSGQILKKEINAKFPFSVKDHSSKKLHATLSVLGLNVKVVMNGSDGELVVKSVAEQNEEGIFQANLTLYSAKFEVDFYGHFVHVRSLAKETVRRVPQPNVPKEDR